MWAVTFCDKVGGVIKLNNRMSYKSRGNFVVQSLSHVLLFATPWTAVHLASLSFTISWSWLKFMSIESVTHLFRQQAGFPGGSDDKESACNAGDLDLIPRSGRSLGKGNGYPLRYSCFGNSVDRGAWWATVYGVTERWKQLSDFSFHLT